MQFLSSWWRGTTPQKGEPIAAASVVDRNHAQQKTLELKAKQAEHKAKRARADAAIKAKEKGGMQMATQLLRQARLWDRQALQLRQQVTSLASQSIILDEATTNAEVAGLMKESLHTGQSALKTLDVDDIADVADDWEELTADSLEVGRALSRPMGLGFEDDDAIDQELAELTEAVHLEESTAVIDTMPRVPVPTNHKNDGGSGNGNVRIKQNGMVV